MGFRFRTVCIAICYFFLNSCSYDVSRKTPVYIEDYHTGSFFWLAEHLDWNEEYVLLLFDTHSDAFSVYRSRDLRKDLVASLNQNKLEAFLRKLKEHSIIQCYNWLEPLLPFPVSEVIWVFPHRIDDEVKTALRAQVRKELCAHGHNDAYASCAMEKLFTIMDFEGLLATETIEKPCVVSIDLDYFTAMNRKIAKKRLHRILDFIFTLPRLEAVTAAVSNIYLRGDTQGHYLLFLLMDYLVGRGNTAVYFEPFVKYKKDASREAKEFLEKGARLPAYDIEQAPDYLKQLLCIYKTHIHVGHDNERWCRLLVSWEQELGK